MRVIFILAIFCLSTEVFAAKTWGVGGVIGAPTGFSLNYFITPKKTLHSTLAFDFNGRDEVQIASHLTWRQRSIDVNMIPVGWFYGVGGKFTFIDQDYQKVSHKDDFLLGPSATIGAFYDFENVPVELFVKSNLTIAIIPSTDADLDLMLGAHYNF